MDNIVVMPIATARSQADARAGRGQAHVLLAERGVPTPRALSARPTAILRQRHRMSEGMENDFRIRSQEEFRKTQKASSAC